MAVDPTRTLTLRRRFEGEARKRFRRVRGLVRDALTEKDALGLKANDRPGAAREAQFDFRRDSEKVEAFMEWLNNRMSAEVLGVEGPARRNVGENAWASKYIASAYQQGMQRGRTEIGKRTEAGFSQVGDDSDIQEAFQRPFHADRVGLIYTRAYRELRGITEAVDAQVSGILADGLAQGMNPNDIAQNINRSVSSIGEKRATVMARTEVIRAHHSATINTYREAGIDGVEIEAEWSTAGDTRVCARCASREGQVYSLDKAEGMIPLHPQCRCVALPKVTRND